MCVALCQNISLAKKLGNHSVMKCRMLCHFVKVNSNKISYNFVTWLCVYLKLQNCVSYYRCMLVYWNNMTTCTEKVHPIRFIVICKHNIGFNNVSICKRLWLHFVFGLIYNAVVFCRLPQSFIVPASDLVMVDQNKN